MYLGETLSFFSKVKCGGKRLCLEWGRVGVEIDFLVIFFVVLGFTFWVLIYLICKIGMLELILFIWLGWYRDKIRLWIKSIKKLVVW